MADPITWGMINLVKKGVKGVQTTLDGVKNSVDTLPEDVQTKLDAFEVTIDELKKNVEDSLADVQETVDNSPAGILPPSMQYIKCVSHDSGVNVTYKANLALSTDGTIYDYIYNNNIASITKGVMVRYRTDTYPLDINDGKLAFIDEDISEFVTNKQIGPGSLAKTYGVIQAKEKTQLVTGLTQNQYYYFTAFPFSSNNVYLEAPTRDMSNSTGINCIRVQWTGTKGTLTVNVTQDYDYKPLGEYTATMTPTAGGEAIVKTQSGAATVVFSGLEAGEYTLSFSAPQYFTAPQSQNVTVVAGQSQSKSIIFSLSAKLNDFTWTEIKKIKNDNNISNMFSVGDTKEITVFGSNKINMILSHIYGSYVYFTSKELLPELVYFDESCTGAYDGEYACYIGSDIEKYVDSAYNTLSEDLKNNILDRPMTFCSFLPGSNGGISKKTKNCKLWIPFIGDLGLETEYDRSDPSVCSHSRYDSYIKMDYYGGIKTRAIKTRQGVNSEYNLATLIIRNEIASIAQVVMVHDELDNNNLTGSFRPNYKKYGVCVGFCI